MENENGEGVSVEVTVPDVPAPEVPPTLSLEFLADQIRVTAEAVAELRALRDEVLKLHEQITGFDLNGLDDLKSSFNAHVESNASDFSRLESIFIELSAAEIEEEEEEEEEEEGHIVLPGEAASVEEAAAAEALVIIPPSEIPAETKKKRGFIHL